MRKSKKLKPKLFKRDGWHDGQKWLARCAFGCGEILNSDTATIDHWPIPRRLGGTLKLDNTRLACRSCNSKDIENAGYASQLIPPGLAPAQRQAWWREQENQRYSEW